MAPIVAVTTLVVEQKPELVRQFDYDARAPLSIVEIGSSAQGAAEVHDVTYVSPKGGNVPAYLVVPKQRGRFAAILWGHWYWENSPQRNRSEFLAEAVTLAQAGVVSLLTDGPIARPGHVQNREPLNEQQATDLQQQVIDMRRGADLLLARADVDSARLAYVGHSYNATVGGILSGVDRRFKAFVLMAGTLSDDVDLRSQEYQDFRTRIGPEKFDAFVAGHTWMDPGQFVAHAAPATLFLQYATRENFLTPSRVREYEKLVSNPKRFKLYEAPHALNAAARRDRIAFLTEQLQLAKLPQSVIDAIPDLVQPPAPQR
jgi:dienelactone hydrolase